MKTVMVWNVKSDGRDLLRQSDNLFRQSDEDSQCQEDSQPDETVRGRSDVPRSRPPKEEKIHKI